MLPDWMPRPWIQRFWMLRAWTMRFWTSRPRLTRFGCRVLGYRVFGCRVLGFCVFGWRVLGRCVFGCPVFGCCGFGRRVLGRCKIPLSRRFWMYFGCRVLWMLRFWMSRVLDATSLDALIVTQFTLLCRKIRHSSVIYGNVMFNVHVRVEQLVWLEKK